MRYCNMEKKEVYNIERHHHSSDVLERMTPQERHTKSLYSQLIVSFGIMLNGVLLGMATGHSAVLLPQLQSDNSSFTVDEDTGSWIASSNTIVSPIGCLCGGVLMEMWGRWKIICFGKSGMIVGWLMIVFAQNATMLLAGRIVEGLARGVAVACVVVLYDELADPKYRGSISGSTAACASIGILLISGLSTILHWNVAAIIATCVTALCLILFMTMSESPVWLVRKKRTQEAERALRWLWGPGREDMVANELRTLICRFQSKDEECKERDRKKNIRGNISQFFKSCKPLLKPRILKPFFINHFFNTIQVTCGVLLITYYTVDVLSKLKRDNIDGIDEYLGNIVIAISRLLTSIVSAVLMLLIGRRTIGIISGTGSTISAILLAVILILQKPENRPISAETEVWVNFVLIIIFFISGSFGFFFLPTVMMGEMLPAQIRSFVCGYMFTMNDILLGVVVKMYPSLTNSLGINGLFLLFGFSCFLCTIFIYLFVPETKDRTLIEIEDYFRKPNIFWITRNKYMNKVEPTMCPVTKSNDDK